MDKNMKMWAIPVIALVLGVLVGFFVSDSGLLGEGFKIKSLAVSSKALSLNEASALIGESEGDTRMNERKCKKKCGDNGYLYTNAGGFRNCECYDLSIVTDPTKGPLTSSYYGQCQIDCLSSANINQCLESCLASAKNVTGTASS